MDFVFDTENPIETLDKVPSNFQHLYTETSDGYVVADEHKSIADTINGLSANLENSRKTKKQASDESASRRLVINAVTEALRESGFEAEDLNHETVSEFVTGLRSQAEGNTLEVQEQLRNQRKEMQEAQERALQKEKDISAGYRRAIDDLLIDSQATSAIASNKGIPELLLPAIKSRTKVVKSAEGRFSSVVVDADGETRFNGKGDPMTIAELVIELKDDKTYGRAFEADVQGGGGTPPAPKKKSVSQSQKAKAGDDAKPASKIAAGLAALSKR